MIIIIVYAPSVNLCTDFYTKYFYQTLTKQLAKYHFPDIGKMVKKTAWLATRRNLETYQQRGV